jgi:RNA polymerase sigma-70 factor (ECF subfamily)
MPGLTDSSETLRLLERAHVGDRLAFNQLVARHRDELRRFISRRLDPRVRTRIDPSDIIQDTHLEAFRRLADYCARRPMPFHIWLQKNAYDRLRNINRDHIKAARRSVERERRSLDQSSVLIAEKISDGVPSPSEQLAKREFRVKVAHAVAQLPETDREILLMRHVEQKSHREIAFLLDISHAAARQRYARALLKLEEQLRERGIHGTWS